MRDLVRKEKLQDKILVDSAGTHGWHQGEAPDTRSVQCAKAHGIDISDLRSRRLQPYDFDEFDLIVVKDERNLRDIGFMTEKSDSFSSKAKVKKILEYAPQFGEDVPDPYYNDGFDRVFDMIEASCKNLLQEIKQKI